MKLRVREQVDEIIMHLCLLDSVPESCSLKQDLGFDSFKTVQLILEIEMAFGIEIEESDLNPTKLNTITDLYELVERYNR